MTRPKRRATILNSEGRRRLDRLRRRLAFLEKRSASASHSHDIAEASALAWVIAKMQCYAKLARAVRALQRLRR